jgi:hypothetical protein
VALNSIAPLTRSKPIAIPRQTKSYFVYTTVYAANYSIYDIDVVLNVLNATIYFN